MRMKRSTYLLAAAAALLAGALSAAQWGILNGFKNDVVPQLRAVSVAATVAGTPTPTVVCHGCIYTVAGSGTQGYGGDNGSATAVAAELNYPYGVAVDGSGNIFIADTDNQVVREVVHATGAITTIAGGGASYPGDGGPALSASFSPGGLMGIAVDGSGNYFVVDENANRVREVLHWHGGRERKHYWRLWRGR